MVEGQEQRVARLVSHVNDLTIRPDDWPPLGYERPAHSPEPDVGYVYLSEVSRFWGIGHKATTYRITHANTNDPDAVVYLQEGTRLRYVVRDKAFTWAHEVYTAAWRVQRSSSVPTRTREELSQPPAEFTDMLQSLLQQDRDDRTRE